MKYLLPDDVDNFSSSRAEFHALTCRILPRHEERKRKYSEISCGLVRGGELIHPILLFRDILEGWQIAWYVKTMFIEPRPGRLELLEEGALGEARTAALGAKGTMINPLRVCPCVDRAQCQNCTVDALWTRYEGIMTIVVSRLPCLESIYFANSHKTTMLEHQAIILSRANSPNHGGSHAPCNVKHVEEDGSDTRKLDYMERYTLFCGLQYMACYQWLCRLPSIRRYVGRHLFSHDSPWTPPEPKSSITSLEFDDCMIHTVTLRSAFSGIENLRDFTYECHWEWEILGSESRSRIFEGEWQPGEIILGLLEFAAHSLVELDLTRNGSKGLQHRHRVTPFIGSLRGFQVLKDIRIQNEGFVEEDAERFASGTAVHRLVDLLPASVVVVALATPQLGKNESDRIMEGLPELKAERVPKLEKVIVEGDKCYEDLRTIFKAGGIELVL